MRKLLAAVAACGLVLALGSGAWAQETKNRNANQDANRGDVITVRGVVAEVAAEGEMAIDYRTNQAVLVAATYLTIVETPSNEQGDKSKQGDADRKNKDKDNDKDQANKDQADEDDSTDRRNVYIVWLSPRTKVYQASASGKDKEKKEVSLDAIDVGELVEVQMTRRDESQGDAGANQRGPARRKHGRYRVMMGDALAITILTPDTDDKDASRKQDAAKPGDRDSKRDN